MFHLWSHQLLCPLVCVLNSSKKLSVCSLLNCLAQFATNPKIWKVLVKFLAIDCVKCEKLQPLVLFSINIVILIVNNSAKMHSFQSNNMIYHHMTPSLQQQHLRPPVTLGKHGSLLPSSAKFVWYIFACSVDHFHWKRIRRRSFNASINGYSKHNLFKNVQIGT